MPKLSLRVCCSSGLVQKDHRRHLTHLMQISSVWEPRGQRGDNTLALRLPDPPASILPAAREPPGHPHTYRRRLTPRPEKLSARPSHSRGVQTYKFKTGSRKWVEHNRAFIPPGRSSAEYDRASCSEGVLPSDAQRGFPRLSMELKEKRAGAGGWGGDRHMGDGGKVSAMSEGPAPEPAH